MEAIVRMVADKIGVSEDKARTAVDVVLDQLRKMLPPAAAAQLSALTSGQAAHPETGSEPAASSTAEGLMGKVGKMFG